LSGGAVSIAGHRLRRPNPRRSLARGLSMVPASRRDDGLFLIRPISENASIGSLPGLSRAGIVRRHAEAERVAEVFARLGVPADRGRSAVSTLSGGNQQKVLFARSLLRGAVALIAHEPTRGVDIGAKAAIYELLRSLAEEGMGVLLISSEPQELIGLSHRVIVMHRGRISDELEGADICEERILTAAMTDSRHDAEVGA
jgi:ABC-type sugar transport system ATPase subunit